MQCVKPYLFFSDFRFPEYFTLNFLQGSNSSSKICYTVDILKDIEYEGEKNFTLVISQSSAERLYINPQRTTIVITDYNGERGFVK